jgi:hypothetical protein
MAHINSLLGSNLLDTAQQGLAGPGVSYFHLPVTATHSDQQPYGGSFSHLIFKQDKGPISPLFDMCYYILCSALDQEGVKLRELYRIRLGLITRTPHRVTHEGHVDDHRPHSTGLFYPIDSDGDTLIYNETQPSQTFSIKESITPKENSWHSFNGAHYHSSQSPIQHERRLVVTFNYLLS